MATLPDTSPDGLPAPDIIEPQSPPETPVPSTPLEEPAGQPDEITPPNPDTIQPDNAPIELPPD